VRLRLLVLLTLLGAACSRPPRSRCDRVCAREARCAAELHLPDLDVVACVDTCNDLERDPEGRRLVNEHVLCVDNAPTCTVLIDCP
jgi:hypothetical protein